MVSGSPVNLLSHHSRARARAVAVMMVTRRQLPARGRGSSATAIRGNNFAEGIFYGLARFARAEPVDSDEQARSTGHAARPASAACAAFCEAAGGPQHGGRRRCLLV